MQIVIDIPDRIQYGIEKGITKNGSEASQIVLDAVKNGTPLPKGHGRLIDADAFIKEECSQCDGCCEVCDCDCLNCKSECRCDFIKDVDSADVIIEADMEVDE